MILDAVDWVDWVDWVDIRPGKLLANGEALNRSNEIASTLQLIHNARVQDDDRCLRPPTKEEEDLDGGNHTMAGADEPLNEDASMNTQMPFGTQMQHPIRSRNSGDEVSFVGINRLEPVLAGNTQRAELKPRSGISADEQRRQAQLLSLIRPKAPQSPTRRNAHSTPEPRRSGEPVATTSPRPGETPSKRANRERIEELSARATQTPQEKGKKRMREAETESPSTHSAKKTSFSEDQPKPTNASEDRFAAECPWMKGLNFNRAAATVPEDQNNILVKPESWHKPQPGSLGFPEPNIPMSLFTVFSRIIDEKAALEGATSSGSFHETPSSGSYPANSAPQPTDEQDEQDSESEDEAPTSPVSWQTSPTPEPPQRPTLSRQSLPPDSSLEMPQDLAEPAASQRPAVRRDQPPPSTLPASSHGNEEDLPPSSPPAQLAAADSDDDMELETSVPQALGEDLLSQPASRPTPNHVSRTELRSKSVVQVKETPYVKGKNGQQPVVTVCPPSQESNRRMENSSSASLIRGTYQDMSSSAVEETRLDGLRKGNSEDRQGEASAGSQAHVQDAQVVLDDDAQDMSMFDMFVHEDLRLESVPQDRSEKQARNLHTETMQVVQAQPEPTPMSAQLPPKDSSSGEQAATVPAQTAMPMPTQPERRQSRQPSETPSLAKRKLETSPTQDRRRGSKHKRPKLKYAFGGHDPQTLIRERKESLRIERQKSTTSAESRQGSVSNVPVQQNPDTKMADLDAKDPVKAQVEEANAPVAGGMSPRHQSLYATPSPVLRPAVTHPATAAVITENISIDQSGQDASAGQTIDRVMSERPAAAQQEEVPSRSESPPAPQPEPQAKPTSTSAPVSISPPASAPRLPPTPSPPSAEVPVSKEQAPPTASDDSSAPLTVFDKFKAAYPEYKANVKHFRNQCKQMEELDREDKMVPKWMWDDFIIRNRTDFAKYAADCIDAGEEPMKYIRFYKDTIRDAIYRKGIIETRAVLLQALQELGVQPPTAKAPEPQPPVQQDAQPPSFQASWPPGRQFADARQPRRQSAQHSSREPIQPSPRQSAPRQTHSPMPPSPEPAITPPKRKSSRKSLPFTVPSNATSERVNSTTHVRHSLPASSSRAVPASTLAQIPSTRLPPSAQRKSRSSLGNAVRWYATEPSASPLETGTGNEYRDFIKAQEALAATTGSKRVSSTPAPRKERDGSATGKRRS